MRVVMVAQDIETLLRADGPDAVARGLVAARLVVSERTVAHHLEHAYTKMGVTGRGAAALWAIRNGLLMPESDPG